MFSLISGIIILFTVLAVYPIGRNKIPFIKPASIIGTVLLAAGAFNYNDAGYCQHTRTIFGNETATCSTGWHFIGWGKSTAWPWEITVANTTDSNAKDSSVSGPYRVRLSDNWTGDVTQTTRFAIPKDPAQFIDMARKFRSPERLITTTLKPAVTASMDSVSNMFTMEEYYAGGKRDQFKSEFKDTIEKGRAQVKQISVNESGIDVSKVSPNDSPASQDTSDVGSTEVRKIVVEKVLDKSGNPIRIPHDYIEYGITVSSAILENLDPDDAFETQIKARKDAASRRIVAREQRLEQEEQRLLAIQTGETEIAKRQAAAKVEQIQKTTDAETSKKLALIEADKLKEQAQIAKETALLQLDKARIDAKSVQVTADAEAYKKREILKADGALAQKLEVYVKTQQVWANAASRMNVPSTMIGASGAEGSSTVNTANTFMQLMTMKTAKDLNLNMSTPKVANQ